MYQKMKRCILLFLLTWTTNVICAPIDNDSGATIISYDYQVKEDGYFFTYTTSNGITREENAVLIKDVNSKDEDQILRINGFYSYTDEANIVHRVDYVADENGYKILSKAPSVPTAGRGYAYGAQEPKGISTAALASLGGS